MGLHDIVMVEWEDKEYVLTVQSVPTMEHNIIMVFLLHYLNMGIFLPYFYDFIKILHKNEVEVLFKKSREIFKKQEYDNTILSLDFLRIAYVNNKQEFTPNSLFILIELHLIYLDSDKLIQLINNNDFHIFTKESIKIITKKSCFIPRKKKQLILKELNKN